MCIFHGVWSSAMTRKCPANKFDVITQAVEQVARKVQLLAERSCRGDEDIMTIIVTCDLRKGDVPYQKFKWPTFSKFALTFDPLSEVADEFNQVPVSATLSDTWTPVTLR